MNLWKGIINGLLIEVLALSILLALCQGAWATNVTCYVSLTGSNTSPYDTPAKAANLPSTCITYTQGQTPSGTGLGQGHNIYILEGTYSDNLLWANNNLNGESLIGVSDLNTLAPSLAGHQPLL